MAKEPKPRQNKRAPDRQAAAPARWSVISESPGYVYLKRSDFLTADGSWDRAAQYAAQQKYPGKDLIYQDNGGSSLFLPASKYQNRDGGGANESAWKQYKKELLQAKTVNFYDDRNSAGGEKTVVPRIVRVHTDAATIKRDWIEQPKTSFGERLTDLLRVAKTSDKKSAEVKKIAAKPISKPKKSKKVVRRKSLHVPHGGRLGPRSLILGKHQIIAKSGRAWYVSPKRIAQRAAAQKDRLAQIKQQTKIRLAQDKAKAKIKAREQKKVIARRKVHAKAFFASKPQIRARQAAAKAVGYAKQLRNLPGFGKTPVKMLLQQNRMSRDAPGKRAVMSAMTHAEKYPARKLGGKAPFSSSASGRQSLANVTRPYMNSVGELVSGQTLRPSIAGGSMFATASTIHTPKFPEGGAGIFFRIDAEQVIANLTQKYPAALRAAAIEAADRIGRKMLDIIEPYVPKDTGLLYTSGETNVRQTAAGLVDMAGGEAYPSGQMFGVSVSYNAPYAEMVYFDEEAAHGKAYNAKHGTSEKGDKETARWIEAAFEHEKGALQGLLFEYSREITLAIGKAGGRTFTRASGKSVTFFPR